METRCPLAYKMNKPSEKIFKEPTRVWINQPSIRQALHEYHGKVGIAFTNSNGDTYIYFTEGSLISMKVPVQCLETKNSHADIFKQKR